MLVTQQPDRIRTEEEYTSAAVLWRAHRMHKEHRNQWCRFCQSLGPCVQWRRTRQALLDAGLLVVQPERVPAPVPERRAPSIQQLGQALNALRREPQ